MIKRKVTKGCYGYIKYNRAFTAVRTAVYFLLSAMLYVTGVLTTGSNKNLLTVAAVLGCLPACKSAINMIMFFIARGCSTKAWEMISAYDDKLTGFYDMYFTSYQKNFPISHMVLKGNIICAYTESDKCDCSECERHLEQMLMQDGYKNITIKTFSSLKKYIDRLSQLEKSDIDENKNANGIIRTLCSISL